jgi:hypothetical protein
VYGHTQTEQAVHLVALQMPLLYAQAVMGKLSSAIKIAVQFYKVRIPILFDKLPKLKPRVVLFFPPTIHLQIYSPHATVLLI